MSLFKYIHVCTQYGTSMYVFNVAPGRLLMRHGFLIFLLVGGVTPALAQMQAPGSGAGQISKAAQLPLSGNSSQTGAVSAQQSSVSGSGAATINSSIQVNGN